jgi:hypothetical protein
MDPATKPEMVTLDLDSPIRSLRSRKTHESEHGVFT